MERKKRASAKSATKKSTARSSGTREGLKKLSQEADKTIGEDCGVIVSALRDKAKEGSISSAKLLVQLADREAPEEVEAGLKRPRKSLSTWLVTQPEWPGFPKSAKKDAN